jgi:phenylpropionate dioxygenase-like ring-hydroxylating dioxygenase large terminal subunit
MGPGEPPPLPSYDGLFAPQNQRNILKVLQESNYLNGVEGNVDPAHVSFLHKLFGKSEQKAKIDQYALKGQGAGPNAPAVTDIWGEDVSPTIEFESTDFGVRYVSLRKAGPQKIYIRGGAWIMPNMVAAPGPTAADGYTLSWHVPIDDDKSWRYSYTYRRGGPVDPEGLLKKEHASQMGPNHRPIRNKANRFLQDREQMKTGWASGFGPSIVIQDVAMTDLQGAIPDHTEERLGYTDRVITATRLMMLKAARDLKAGREARRDTSGRAAFPVVVSDLLSNSEDWKAYYDKRVREEEAIALNVQKIRP